MTVILYLFSIAFLSAGCVLILYTTEYRRWFQHFVTNTPPKILAALPAGIGLLLIISAFGSRYPAVIIILGILALLKGALILLNPNQIFDQLKEWMFNRAGDQTLRLFGIIAVVLGTAMVSWIK
ncbi:MAG: hypothetical protein QNJ22_21545 [Desulfosarcinaceae bacterium]|nr:hypothetical protein [Desulfosarcinaceae bacterium]